MKQLALARTDGKTDGLLTGEDLKVGTIKERNKAFGGLRHHLTTLSSKQQLEYSELQDDKARMQYMANFMMKPEDGGCLGKVTTSVENNRTDGWMYRCLLEETFAGPAWLNSK